MKILWIVPLLVAVAASMKEKHLVRHRDLERPDCTQPNGQCEQSSECCDKHGVDYVCCIAKKKNKPGWDPNTKTCQESPCSDD